uniref:Uncharacterized protein n=1 Tax=Arundo donax TaxID=35708 RepID=A0A0A9FYU7_ARUDO
MREDDNVPERRCEAAKVRLKIKVASTPK